MPLALESFKKLALEDPERQWELHHGRLQKKPGMSFVHNRAMVHLGHHLLQQLDLTKYDVRVNAGRVRPADDTNFIPDIFVFPIELAGSFRDRRAILEV